MACLETWCRACGGDGGSAYPINVDYRDGSLIEGWDECTACDGTGGMSLEEAADFDLAEIDAVNDGDPGWADPDLEAMTTQPAKTVAESLNLLDAMRPLLKPTCDSEGNWRYVPAVLIDGPRVPKLRVRVSPSFPPKPYFIVDPHGRHAIGADPDEAIGKFVARYLSDEAARVAVEGKRMDEVAA